VSGTRRLAAVLGVVAVAGLATSEALAGELTLSAPKCDAPAGGEATVSLRANVDAETSALQGGLRYDATLVDVLDVSAGAALPAGARADFNADQPGWLRLGFVCSPSRAAFRGEGEVLRIKVRAKGVVGAEGALRLLQVRAWEPNDAEHRATTVDGSLRIVESATIPWIPIAAGVAIFALVAILVLRRRRPRPVDRSRVPTSVPAPGSRPSEGRGRFCTSCGTPVRGSAARFCDSCGTRIA
jgi:hypothetical protein